MGPLEAITTCLRKFFTFSGRASRSEYWWFALAVFAASSILGAIPIQQLSSGFGLLIMLPNLAAAWRRAHDAGFSGFVNFLPILVGLIVGILGYVIGGLLGVHFFYAYVQLFVLGLMFLAILVTLYILARPSEPGPNRYGPNPHEVTP